MKLNNYLFQESKEQYVAFCLVFTHLTEMSFNSISLSKLKISIHLRLKIAVKDICNGNIIIMFD